DGIMRNGVDGIAGGGGGGGGGSPTDGTNSGEEVRHHPRYSKAQARQRYKKG
ncbi:hypothetical protein SK128_014040, partial [Halocaridina rubra]